MMQHGYLHRTGAADSEIAGCRALRHHGPPHPYSGDCSQTGNQNPSTPGIEGIHSAKKKR